MSCNGLPRTMKKWCIATAFYFTFILAGASHAYSTGWSLCVASGESLYFVHDFKGADLNCQDRVRVTQVAFLVGSVNFGLRVTFSDTGRIIIQRKLYLPRGTPILVLNTKLNGRTLAYIWHTNTFVLLASTYNAPERGASPAWKQFDERFDSGRFAITMRRTAFFQTLGSDRKSVEIPSGRLVRIQNVLQDDDQEIIEVEFDNAFGYANARDLRPIERPELDREQAYQAGSTVLAERILKPCGIRRSVSGLIEASQELGITAGISFRVIAELAAQYKTKIRTNESLLEEISENVFISVATVSIFREPSLNSFLTFLSRLFGTIPSPDRRDISATTISYCNGSFVQLIIAAGGRDLILNGPISIRNEGDYEKYRSVFDRAGLDDDAFFILSLLSRGDVSFNLPKRIEPSEQ